MVARDRLIDKGLLALTTESDTVFLCASDPNTWSDANSSHVGLKSGSRGSMFLPISSPPGGGRMASLAGFGDGSITSNGAANYVVVADSVLQNIIISEPLAQPQAVQAGGKFSVTTLAVILGASSQPQPSNLTVGSPVFDSPTLISSGYAQTANSLTVNSPIIDSPVMIWSGAGWFNTPVSNEIGVFSVEFDAVPSALALDCAIGLSDGPEQAYTGMATIVLFTTGNIFQARNGGAYAADNALSYVAGTSYHIRMVINVTNHTYSVFVTPFGSGQTTIATNYAFRSEQSTVGQLNNFVIGTGAVGTVTISNLYIGVLTANSLTVSSPVLPQPLLNNKVGVSANGITTNSPTIDQAVFTPIGGGYNNLTNYPDGNNRPVVTAGVLNWTGPLGGGVSTASDADQNLVLSSSGGLTLSTAGQTISGLDISGGVVITANNITLRRCRITSNATATVDVINGVTGTVVEDCYIDGLGTQTFTNGGFGIRAQSGTFRRNQIVRTGNSFAVLVGNGPTLIVDNYCWNMQSGGGPHYDQIQMDGNINNVTISHNTLINEQSQTSVVMIDNGSGPMDNILVDNNRLIGGGAPCYCDGSFQPFSPLTNVRYTNNRLGIGAIPGYVYFAIFPPTFTGNVDDVTGAAIPASALPSMSGSFSVTLPASNGQFVGNMTMNNLPAPAFCRMFLTDFNGAAISDSSKFIITNSNTGAVAVNTASLTAGTYHPAVQAFGPNGFTMTLATIVVGASTVKNFTANALTVGSPVIPTPALNNKVGFSISGFTAGRPAIGQPVFTPIGVGGGYDNLANWPSPANRPALSGSVITWNGPSAGGASTSSDTAGLTRTLTTSSGMSSSANGQVIQGFLFTGSVTITHQNVTVKQCAFTGSSQGVKFAYGANVTGLIVEDCYFNGNKASYEGICPVIGSGSLVGTGNQSIIRRCYMSGYENHITLWPANNYAVLDCYVTACGNSGSSSFDGDMIEVYAGSNGLIQHNMFDGNNSQQGNLAFNSMINFTGTGANISNVTVNNNMFANCQQINAFIICDDNGQGGSVSIAFTNNGFVNIAGKAKRRDSVPISPNSGNYTAASMTATSGTVFGGI